jgi:DNA-directed RNA polymerase subunit H (RpoH/RPB5)
MDIQKIKELALANGFSLKEQASGNMDLHSYVYEFANAIEQAAKAQAVPEGFVVVAKELPEKIAEKMAIDRIDKPIHENDPVWSEIAEESYKNQVKLKKWEFWRDYKAMIEAQEPAND